MSWHKGPKKASKKVERGYKEQTVEDVLENTEVEDVIGIPERGLTPETCKFFGIRVEYDQKGNGDPVAHYFPITYRGKLVGFIKRDLNKPKKVAWSTIGSVTDDCDLFGQVRFANKTAPYLFVVEGMYDAPSMWQALKENQYTGGKKPRVPHVVSIVLGTPNAIENCKHNEKFISRYKEARFAFDNDEKGPDSKPHEKYGKEATSDVCLYFNNAKYIPLQRKDPNEYIVEGESEVLYDLAMHNASEWKHESIVKGAGVTIDDLEEDVKPGVPILCAPALQEKLDGFRDHEWTLILGVPKSGKTTLARMIVKEWLDQGEVVCYASLEDTRVQVVNSLIALDNDVDGVELDKDPSLLSREAKQHTLDNLLGPDKFMMVEAVNNKISPTEVTKLCENAILEGATKIVFDHYSYLVSGDTNNNERKVIDNLLTDMESLKKRYPVHILGIAHVTIDKRRGIVTDDNGEVVYPYWYRVDRYDGRGSGSFTQLMDNMICIDAQYIDDQVLGLTQLKLALNRRRRKTGACDYMSLDDKTGKLKAIDEPGFF